jgi:hypothetical protein
MNTVVLQTNKQIRKQEFVNGAHSSSERLRDAKSITNIVASLLSDVLNQKFVSLENSVMLPRSTPRSLAVYAAGLPDARNFGRFPESDEAMDLHLPHRSHRSSTLQYSCAGGNLK